MLYYHHMDKPLEKIVNAIGDALKDLAPAERMRRTLKAYDRVKATKSQSQKVSPSASRPRPQAQPHTAPTPLSARSRR